MVPDFSIHVYRNGGKSRLVLTGEMDIATAPAFEGAAVHLCREGATHLVLDLSELEFMDSTGLHAVLKTVELCRESDCDFCLVPGPAQIHKLFEIAGVAEVLPCCGPDEVLPSSEHTQLWPEPV